MKKLVNPQYEYLSPLLDSLIQPDYFGTHGEVLYDVGRNLVKRFRLAETDVVVKRFGRITSFNRLMYATVRESKAMRAYTYASKLRSMGISTPDEIPTGRSRTTTRNTSSTATRSLPGMVKRRTSITG